MMTVLCDSTLRERLWSGEIVVEPLADNAVRPASIDVRLGEHLLIRTGERHVDPDRDDADQWEDSIAIENGAWWLWPGVPYLATTLERIEVPDDLACQLQGRSSLARCFVSLHQQAGWLDPGYQGRPTLEISVLKTTVLRPGQPIGQLVFFQLDRPAGRPYGHPDLGSRYQGDDVPRPARPAEGRP